MESSIRCCRCRKTITPIQTLHDGEYYIEKSIEKYGDDAHGVDILIEEEVSKNPLYDPKLKDYELTEEDYKEIFDEIKKDNQPPKPKCPTCGSTNIQKISDLRKAGGAILFGIFSKDAKSQFECKNCGYKW